MTAAGIFLVLHGLLHLAVWLPPPAADAPFDPRRSWLLGDATQIARPLAILASALFVTAGFLLLGDSNADTIVILASIVSALLVVLTFNRWLVGALLIDCAIVVIALG